MTLALPTSAKEAAHMEWSEFEVHYQSLLQAELTEETLRPWLGEWTRLTTLIDEIGTGLHVATSVNTADQEAQDSLLAFARNIAEKQKAKEQEMKMKLLNSGLSFPEIEQPLKQVKAAVDLFREENLPRETQLIELSTEYDKLCGARTVIWKGEEAPLSALDVPEESSDPAERKEAWTLRHNRILEDRAALNDLWGRMHGIRQEIAKTAGKPSFVEYSYDLLDRFDYGPKEAQTFRDAILETVVPAAERIKKRKAERLGVPTLRPWDADAPAYGAEPLKPYSSSEELISKSAAIFEKLDPQFATWFRHMDSEGLMDLFGRKNKADGGYCTVFPYRREAYIFMNAVGTHDNLQTLLHEAGHCFHAYECLKLQYHLQSWVGSEFAEVASMGMEMLCQRHLDAFYSPEDSARAQIQHLEKCLQFWPYMAVVDGFQHWAYTSPEGSNPEACDAEWQRLWRLYMKGLDFSGLEDLEKTGWHRKLHIFQVPFYYIEYGLAQVGAMQVWANSRANEADAVAKYRKGLSLGSTVSLPRLFEAAGGRFSFDSTTLGSLVKASEDRIEELLAQLS